MLWRESIGRDTWSHILITDLRLFYANIRFTVTLYFTLCTSGGATVEGTGGLVPPIPKSRQKLSKKNGIKFAIYYITRNFRPNNAHFPLCFRRPLSKLPPFRLRSRSAPVSTEQHFASERNFSTIKGPSAVTVFST